MTVGMPDGLFLVILIYTLLPTLIRGLKIPSNNDVRNN